MATKIQVTDPTTGRRKLVSRGVLATSCRLTARKATKSGMATDWYKAYAWYRVGKEAGLTLHEMTDAVTGANGAV